MARCREIFHNATSTTVGSRSEAGSRPVRVRGSTEKRPPSGTRALRQRTDLAGVARDEARGRALVDRAADLGVDSALRLQGADYDLDEITPDADEWTYQRLY